MKKIILCLCLMAMAGLFAACDGGSAEPADTGNGQTEQTQQESANAEVGSEQATPRGEQTVSAGPDDINWDEHITFTWLMTGTPPNDYYTSYSDNPVVNYLEHRFNVTFDIQQAPVGTEADALALMMGSGRFTDVMDLGAFTGSIPQLYYDDIIIDISRWLDYMPNLRNLLDTDPELVRAAYDDDGRILMLPIVQDESGYSFTGLLYRHDILETMTSGNVQFPSGYDAPTTLADWEYMLPLMLEYFESAGFADFAPLIIPPQGVIHFGALMNTFGAFHQFYSRNGVVYAGIMEPEFYDFVITMRDWFEFGWIHQDFASRTGDMFFMPNPPLVFGGAAGVFHGMIMHMGDRMSMPELDMNFDVRPMSSPRAPGIAHQDMIRNPGGRFGMALSSAVYAGNHDIGRFLSIIDLLYSEYGGKLRAVGLTAEQIPPGHTIMDRMGMSEGAYWFDESGNVVFHPNITLVGGHIGIDAVNAIRLPGLYAESILNAVRDDETVRAQSLWGIQDNITEVHPLPNQLSPTVEESAILSTNDARINDHRDQMLTMFIMGTAPLTEATWEEFTNQLIAFGIEENREIWQAAYNRYLVRGR